MDFEQIQVKLVDTMGSDRSIAETAWTSSINYNNKNKRSEEDVIKIINFMAKHKHGTPFESVVFKFWMRIPIFIDRQVVTHRLASHSGLSGRYRTVPTDFYEMSNDVMNIVEVATMGAEHNGLKELWNEYKGHNKCPVPDVVQEYYNSCIRAMESYKDCIAILKLSQQKLGKITNSQFKRARELIRGIIPVSAMTERTTVINLRSFSNFQKLRNNVHAQPEIKKVAELMLERVEEKNICPTAIKALQKEGWQI